MNSEKFYNDILCDIKMQCECVVFLCKEYIFMKNKAQWSWTKSTLRYITEALTCLTGQVTQQM